MLIRILFLMLAISSMTACFHDEPSTTDDALTNDNALVVGDGGNNTVSPAQTLPNKFTFVGEINVEEDIFSDIRLHGEIKNDMSSGYPFIKVRCDFKDVDGFSVGSDYTYVFGGCANTTGVELSTTTALFPGEVGFFTLFTDISYASVDTYICRIEYNDSSIVKTKSRLDVVGEVSKSVSFIETVELAGSVENTGTSDLIFGEVDAVIKNAQGKVIATDFTYVLGEKVYLDNISDYTETALAKGGRGTFELMTLADANTATSYRLTSCGQDETINNGVIYKSAPGKLLRDSSGLNAKERGKQRDRIVEEQMKKLGSGL